MKVQELIVVFRNLAMFLLDLYLFLFRSLIVYATTVQQWFTGKKKLPSANGQVVLVVGAGRGLGKELACQFAKLGSNVVCWDIDEDENNITVDEIKKHGFQANGYQCDVSQRSEVYKIAQLVRKEVGEVNILINAASIRPCHPFLSHNVTQIQRNVSVNLLSNFWTVYEFLPSMVAKKRGHIVAITSFVADVVGVPNLVPYCAAKSGVRGLMKALKAEVHAGNKNAGVQFTTVHLGPIEGEFEKDTKQKHTWLVSTTYAEAAQRIIQGVLLDKTDVYSPRVGQLLDIVWSLFPEKIELQLNDLLGLNAASAGSSKETS
jgi:all-trans-retinol dehydrogenase (NAD+)